ncbi:hypothetical protein BIV57_14135 [Mangrovactinospora gilvigrisea]|uniref:ABM domain-containing protein n=2 Tax=Mangrovactinospora gilvigrisea TaxID=1428644 RepID=A0A1J7CB18_9ACTN|nr:hypothetical protein BIV57_14135 [Mangrovactinospora gilvigrisea]
MVSRLEVKRLRDVLPFLRDSLRIRRQAAAAPGGLGHALAAAPLRRTFWTQSVWADRAAVETFAAARPHRDIVRGSRPRMADSRFVFLVRPASEVRQGLPWDKVREMTAGQG